MAITTFADRLRSKNTTSGVSPEDTDWQLFIRDHKANLIASATIHIVEIDKLVPYLYRPSEYLQFVVNTDPAIAWIVMFINNLATDVEFDRQVTKLLIPSYELIVNLRSTYLAVKAAALKRR